MGAAKTFRVQGTASNFLALPKASSSFDNSRIVVLPAPYEHSVSYGEGTRLGPEAIIRASHYVEFYDEEFRRELCFRSGIATLSPIRFGKRVNRSALDLLEASVAELLDRGKFVVTLGGEHTISLAPVAAHLRRYPDLSVLQFDAHSDLRDSYQDNKFSHACVMSRIVELVKPNRIVQVGIRAQCAEEAEFIEAHKVNTFYAHQIRGSSYFTGSGGWKREVIDRLTDHVYVTFDVDGLDPSIMPSTGTPEPNGLQWSETIELLRMVGEHKSIVGCDVVELSPRKDLSFPDLTAAKLTYKLMNCAFPELSE